MKNAESFFDSFSPFWILFNSEGQILDVSLFFKTDTDKNESQKTILEYLIFNRFYLRADQSIYDAFKGKIIEFEFPVKKLSFRGTYHNIEQNGLIIAWPKLREIADIKKFNLSKEMAHPNSILTDLLITKDLLQKTQSKINQIELKKIESELNFSRQRSKTIIDHMVEGTMVFNSDLELLDWNSSVSKVFNIQLNSRSDFIKLPMSFKLKDSHNEAYQLNELSKLCYKAPFYGTQLQLYQDDLYLKTLRLNCSKAELEEDSFYILTVMDISDEIEKEKILNTQKELAQQSAKLASLGELAAGVGHEINNPLAIISGQLTIMQKDLEKNNLSSKLKDRFTKINKSVHRITNITKGLRTFARADSVENIYFNFSEMLLETIDMLKEIFSKEEVIIYSQVEADVWTYANLGRLQQVVVNLLNNAKDALGESPKKAIYVYLSTLNRSILLKVEDSGSGIPEDILNKMFEPFFTTKEVNKGTGIGLALVDSIIKEHRGHINVSSVVGEGTIFSIEIPIMKDLGNSKVNQNNVENEYDSKDIQTIAAGKKVLVVDDEVDIREVLVDMLDMYGVECLQAASAEEAISVFQENTEKIKLILTDLTMLKMNGIELISYLKKTMNYRHPSYLITGGLNIEIKQVEQVVDGLVTKPINQSDIHNILVKSFLEKKT